MSDSSGLERVTVSLPRILNLRRIKELLAYISKEVPARISYSVGLRGRINEYASPEDESLGLAKREEYVESISGTVIERGFIMVQFSFRRGGRSGMYFDKLRFDIGPNNPEDINPKEVALMDGVREKVQRYFSQQKAH